MEKNRNRERQAIRWSVYDDGLRLWSMVNTLKQFQRMSFCICHTKPLSFCASPMGSEQNKKKPTIKRGLGGQLRLEEN